MFLFVLSHSALVGQEVPYSEPDFSAQIVDVDAISLEGEERAMVVGALAAIAGAEQTGNLVRMKALALALRLDSMDPAARRLNDLLIAGGPLVPAAPGGPELSAAVELLGESARRLSDEQAEEEDTILSAYLLDVAGAFSEDGTPDENGTLQSELDWDLVLGSPGGGAGKKLAAAVEPEIPEPAVAEPATTDPPEAPQREDTPEEMKEPPPAENTVMISEPAPPGEVAEVEFKRSESALRVVVFESLPEGGERAVACRLTVEVSDEERADETNPFYSAEGIGPVAMEQLHAAARLLQQKHGISPGKGRLDFRLTSLEDGRHLPLAAARLGVTALFLLDALLTGEALDDATSLGGTLPTPGGKVAPRGRWGAIAGAAGDSGAAALIVSRSAEADLTDLILAGELEPLLRVQAIQLSRVEEVGAFLAAERDENLVEAMRLFGEVAGLAGRHVLKDLVVNPKVQERLVEVLNLMPNHLSAKLLLAQGRGTLPERMSLRGSVLRIDHLLEPARDLDNLTNSAVIASSRDGICADSIFALRRVRAKLSEGSLAYCDAAIDLVELLREYIKISNRSTSGAMQQAGAIAEVRARAETLRSGLQAAIEVN